MYYREEKGNYVKVNVKQFIESQKNLKVIVNIVAAIVRGNPV